MSDIISNFDRSIDIINKANIILKNRLYVSKDWCLFNDVNSYISDIRSGIEIEIGYVDDIPVSCAVISNRISVFESSTLYCFHDDMVYIDKQYFVQVFVLSSFTGQNLGTMVLSSLLNRLDIDRSECCAGVGLMGSLNFWDKNEISIISL